ncbi:MAG: GspMb/PilO family protein [Burkholderiaceae bacterium]
MNPMQTSRLVRQAAFAWRHGFLPQVVAVGVSAALVAAAGLAAFQLRHGLLKEQALTARLDRAQRDAGITTVPREALPDLVQRLPAAPSVDQFMNVLQHLASDQGVRVASLQSDDHPATPTELGRVGVALTLQAPYPAVVRVLQGLLDRYPGASLRRLELARVQGAGVPTGTMGGAGLAPMPGASAPAAEVEVHVTLDVWSRAVGVVPVPSAQVESPEASAASTASAVSAVSAASVPAGGAS